jgi:hypothetical protein
LWFIDEIRCQSYVFLGQGYQGFLMLRVRMLGHNHLLVDSSRVNLSVKDTKVLQSYVCEC